MLGFVSVEERVLAREEDGVIIIAIIVSLITTQSLGAEYLSGCCVIICDKPTCQIRSHSFMCGPVTPYNFTQKKM